MAKGISKIFGYEGNFGTTVTLNPTFVPAGPIGINPFLLTSGVSLAQVELNTDNPFEDSHILNVTLSRISPRDQDAANVEGYDVFANIEFGNQGFQSRAQVDFVNGHTFSVPGSFVRVNAVAAQFIGFNDTVPIVVGASISIGTFYHRGNTQRTFQNNAVLGVGGLVNVPLAPFASTFQVLRSNPNTSISITQTARVSATVTAVNTVPSAVGPGVTANQNPIIPIANRTSRINISNTGPAPGLTVPVVFQIDL